MAHPKHSSSTTRALARLLAGWLIAIVLVQGFAAGQFLVLGPLHRHQPNDSMPHFHDGSERHRHHPGEYSRSAFAGTP